VDVRLEYQKFGAVWAQPLRKRAWLTTRNTLLIHRTIFGRSRSNSFGTSRSPEKFAWRWGPASLGCRHGWPLGNTLIHHSRYPAKFGGQNIGP